MKNEHEPWMRVENPNYFRDVLGSMVAVCPSANKNGDVFVRFGRLGTGVHPNYQIEMLDGKHPFRGDNHQQETRLNEYTETELSAEQFNYAAVQQLLSKCLEKSQRR